MKEETPVFANRKHIEKVGDDLQGKRRKRDAFEAPLCLNPECKAKRKRYYISNWDISNNNIKTTLLEEYHSAKKTRLENAGKENGSFDRISHTPSNPHSSVFRASFGEGAIATNLMTDQGADGNFISAHLFREIIRNNTKYGKSKCKISSTVADIQSFDRGSVLDLGKLSGYGCLSENKTWFQNYLKDHQLEDSQ